MILSKEREAKKMILTKIEKSNMIKSYIGIIEILLETPTIDRVTKRNLNKELHIYKRELKRINKI